MCGLAGVIDVRDSVVPDVRIGQALDALKHRGPDAHRVWTEGPCTLLHCRLRILDLSERADQPTMLRQRGRMTMVYNGEIYNFRELRDELSRLGYAFATTSDAEVLLTGFHAWGTDVFRCARGMWAAAFWEPDIMRLTLARDPLGKKPLLYAASPERVVFASNMSALVALLDRTPEVDRAALTCYLGHLCVPQEHSVFVGVEKVPPGRTVSWTPGGRPAVTPYWSVPATQPGDLSKADVVTEVERLLRQAVRRRLESDVPLGVFLSAGYDSGLVAAFAAQESGRSLVAITAGTVGSGYDERTAAQSIATRYGLDHHALEVPALSANALPALLGELGEPFGDPSILPSYEVARAARREITVALTGDGGDEGFFGYATFRAVRLAESYRRWVPASVRRLLRDRTRSITVDTWRRRAAALFDYGADTLAESFRNRMGFSREQRERLLRGDGSGTGHVAEHVYSERLRRWARLPDADALRRTFFETFLPNDYLTKVDTATMAASLEARCPFLDIDLVEFTLRLPVEVAFPRGRLKALLRPLVQRHLPAAILQRPKTGFGVPVGQWLRGPLTRAFEEFVTRPRTLMASLVDPAEASALLTAHRRGADHSTRLWSLLALGVWSAVVVERRWAETDPLPMDASVGT